jgi:glycosyltransferase involved in cell wall biosynthesis
MAVKATIIVPTFNHGRIIKYPLRSILAQTEQSFEIFVIGDGLTEKLKKEIGAICKMDNRITLICFPKSLRHGEEYRHQIISHQAKGKYIFYLADDDLWLPEHLEQLLKALQNHDFVHSLHTGINPEGQISLLPTDLGLPIQRRWIIKRTEFGVGLGFAAHSKKYYLEQLQGWRTTPRGIYTDVYMWRQFAEKRSCRIAFVPRPTALHFAATERSEQTTGQREAELSAWFKKVNDPLTRKKLIEDIYDNAINTWVKTDISLIDYIQSSAKLRERMNLLETSLSWRMRTRFRAIFSRIPGLIPLLKKTAAIFV